MDPKPSATARCIECRQHWPDTFDLDGDPIHAACARVRALDEVTRLRKRLAELERKSR